MYQFNDKVEICNNAHDIINFIDSTTDYFLPSTFESIDIGNYAKKIISQGIALITRNSQNNQISGLLTFYFNDKETFTAYISLLAVRTEYRNRKIASSLIQKCINMCIESKMNKIKVETWSSNSIALNFYNKYGFTDTAEYVNEFGINKIILIRIL